MPLRTFLHVSAGHPRVYAHFDSATAACTCTILLHSTPSRTNRFPGPTLNSAVSKLQRVTVSPLRCCRMEMPAASDPEGNRAAVGAHSGLVSPGDAFSARDAGSARPQPRSDPNACQVVDNGEGGSSQAASVEREVGERPSPLAGGARLADPPRSTRNTRTCAVRHWSARAADGKRGQQYK